MTYEQGVTDTEILVGNSASITGGYATTGESINAGIQAYFDMINSEGGINGRKIRFVHVDDGYDTEKAKNAFRYLVSKEKVFAIIGHFGSSIVKETLGCIRKVGIPVVYFATGIGDLYTENAKEFIEGANCYPVQPLYITEGQEMVDNIWTRFGAHKIGIIYTQDDIGRDIAKGAGSKAIQLGIECVILSAGDNMASLDASVEKIKEADCDFLIAATAQKECAKIVKVLAAHDMKKPTITSYLNSTNTMAFEVANVIKDKFELYAHRWLHYDGENQKDLEKASLWLGDNALNGYAHCGWIGAHLFSEGIRRLKDKKITWENFVWAMESAPIKVPFASEIDYSNGKRIGISDFYLLKVDTKAYTGWSNV